MTHVLWDTSLSLHPALQTTLTLSSDDKLPSFIRTIDQPHILHGIFFIQKYFVPDAMISMSTPDLCASSFEEILRYLGWLWYGAGMVPNIMIPGPRYRSNNISLVF